MLLQIEQRRRLALTSRTAMARASASSSLERRMWKARRCALFAPTPGSFFSSSIRRDMGSANLDMGSLQFQSECHSARSEEPMQFAGSERVHRSFASLRMTNVLEPAYAEAAEHAPYR